MTVAESDKILIYTTREVADSPRLKYVFAQVFGEWYGRNVEFSESPELDAHIVYRDVRDTGESLERSAVSVFSYGGREIAEGISEWRRIPVFFEAQEQSAYDVPFDIFRAIFRLISREEEYGSNRLDKHGRYDYKDSFAYRFGFLDRPVIDEWLAEFEKIFNAKFPDTPLVPKKHRHLITIDVDNVFAYKNKGVFRHAFAFAKSLFKGQFDGEQQRMDVLVGKREDPFFNIEEIAEKLPSESVMFFHCGGYGKYDKKTVFPSIKYWRAKQRIDKMINVGLHPSYRSAHCKLLLKLEKWVLEKCLRRKVTATRMHYLLFNFPNTARTLIELGITDDYSIAYSDIAGYRAGTARSFKFYDVEKEEATALTLHPLIVMDKTLRSNMRLTPQEAIDYLNDLKKQCEMSNVPLTMLFHNENLADINGWGEWVAVWNAMLE